MSKQKDFFGLFNGLKPCYAFSNASSSNEKGKNIVKLDKCCKNCSWSNRESDGSYYCEYRRTHVRPNDYCGYWE